MKETGQKKPIAGYDTHETIVTITVREKGKTLEDAGGVVMTNDIWLGPRIPAMKELADFDVKYWKQLQGPEMAAMSAEQMATMMAMYPLVGQGDGAHAEGRRQARRHAARHDDDVRVGDEQGSADEAQPAAPAAGAAAASAACSRGR